MKNQPFGCYQLIVFAALVIVGLTRPLNAADDDAQVQVWSIRATNDNDEVSPELKELVKKLKKTFKFKGYKLVKAETRTVKNQPVTFKLAGDYRMKVTFRKRTANKIELKCEILLRQEGKDKKKLSTTIAVKPEKFQLFGGWSLEDEDVLIIALSAK